MDFVIPGNDDAIRSCKIIEGIADVARDRATQFRAEEEAARREREEAERREAEEKAQRGGEEQERRGRGAGPPRGGGGRLLTGRARHAQRNPPGGRQRRRAPRERRTFDPDEES